MSTKLLEERVTVLEKQVAILIANNNEQDKGKVKGKGKGKVKDKEKKSSGKKMTMDQKISLLNIGKAIREKAKEEGVQPSQFLGYLVAKNPKKYGALAKLEGIIDGQG